LHSPGVSSHAKIVTTAAGLEDLLADLDAEAAIGLDTEFMRERTYRAELCLLQLTTRRGPVCIDPLAVPDLTPLAAALGPGGPPVVLHAGRQDLEVLVPTLGPLAPLFDTQIAAALCGHPAQVGYAELVRRVLGHEVPKGQTRTDWSRRPLSIEQVEYALDDVRHLLPLRERLLVALEDLGRTGWLAEELATLERLDVVTVDAGRAWLRFRGTEGWDEGRLRLLKSLAAWRELRAVARNRPRGWILDDTVLREIVMRVPRDRPGLMRIEGMTEGIVRHAGDELLALVEAARVPDPAPPLPKRERPDPALTARTKRLTEVAQAAAQRLGVATELLATRRVLEEIARGADPVVVLGGWRADVLAGPLGAVG
jgi:ribonuclease D